MDGGGTETERGGSPTRSAQEVLRRMSLNSPPSRVDNPRQVKRAKVCAVETTSLHVFRGIGLARLAVALSAIAANWLLFQFTHILQLSAPFFDAGQRGE